MKKGTDLMFTGLFAILLVACASPRITLFSDASDPLREVTLDGTADDKILMVPITGVITDSPKSRVTRTMPGMVQEVVSHLRLAEKDDRVKVGTVQDRYSQAAPRRPATFFIMKLLHSNSAPVRRWSSV